MLTTEQEPTPRAKHKYYVSLSNGVVYPAQTGNPGVEDVNLGDWRPANPEEIEAYLAGNEKSAPRAGEMDVTVPVLPPTPSVITLQEDDEIDEDDSGADVDGVPPAPAF